jgi:hypothetical protein
MLCIEIKLRARIKTYKRSIKRTVLLTINLCKTKRNMKVAICILQVSFLNGWDPIFFSYIFHILLVNNLETTKFYCLMLKVFGFKVDFCHHFKQLKIFVLLGKFYEFLYMFITQLNF